MPREGSDDLRWTRVGWFNQDRPCDRLVQMAVEVIPGEQLPSRWSKQSFIFDRVMWSQCASYHTLYVNSVPQLRIWTNTSAKKVSVDVSENLIGLVPLLDFVEIPPLSKKRRPEFSYRTTVRSTAELRYLLETVKVMYGLEDK